MKEHDTVFGESQINNPGKWEIKKKKNRKTKLKDEKTSKTKIEVRADIPVIVFSCGGCRPCGHAEYEIIKELEAEKAELINALQELLYDAMNLYQHDPNNFRKTAEEYFKAEIDILQKYTGNNYGK